MPQVPWLCQWLLLAGAKAVRWRPDDPYLERTCSAYRNPLVVPELWADIPFYLTGIPRVPPDSG